MAGVNGIAYGWGHIKIATPWGISFSAQSFEFSDEKEKETFYGPGETVIAYGAGTYKASGKLSIFLEEYKLILAACLANNINGIYNMPPFEIVRYFSAPAQFEKEPDVLIWKNCTFNKRDSKSAQGDKRTLYEFDVTVGSIVENGVVNS